MNNSRHQYSLARLFLLSPALFLGGCSAKNVPVLFPGGPVAATERDLLFTAAALMLIVVVPVFVMAAAFAIRYRASNRNARYTPDWSYSERIDVVVWLVPFAIIVVLAWLVWVYTHRLDPYKRLAAGTPPLQVEVVSLDWKWLFIYPRQDIATVNELVLPQGRQISLRLTSDTVMNSFYVPALAGQIFTMAGMQTRLHLIANVPGRYRGRNTQYSGRGFAKQHFAVRVLPKAGFDAWLKMARQAPNKLDAATYKKLEKPTAEVPVTRYSAVEPHLFAKIIEKYTGQPPAPRTPSGNRPQQGTN